MTDDSLEQFALTSVKSFATSSFRQTQQKMNFRYFGHFRSSPEANFFLFLWNSGIVSYTSSCSQGSAHFD